MSVLSKEDIKFIDNYLANSGIEFIDVRFEMVDHVASEIEMTIKNGDTRSFYFIFKDYMVKNKSILLKNNNKYHWISDRKILSCIIKKSFSFKGFCAFATIFLSFNLIQWFLTESQFYIFIKDAPIVVFFLIVVIYGIFVKKRKERYSSSERIGLYFLILYYIINIFLNNGTLGLENLLYSKIIASLYIFISGVLMVLGFEFKKVYS